MSRPEWLYAAPRPEWLYGAAPALVLPAGVVDGHRRATVRRVERLPSGSWRVEYAGGLVDVCRTDPRATIARGAFPVAR